MKHCPLYNGQNLDFTGNQNPYGLIQNGGKRRRKSRRTNRTKRNNNKRGKTRKSKK